MKLVIDTSVLVNQALRDKGRQLIQSEQITLYQPEYAVGETTHELMRRAALMMEFKQAQPHETEALLIYTFGILKNHIQAIPHADYSPFEAVARRRVPRDPNDWTLVAAALSLEGVGILTLDNDFLGCGLPTWTPETLRGELGL